MSVSEEDDAVKDVVDLRARLVDRRDHRGRVVRVVREGVEDRDDFCGRDGVEAWKVAEMWLCHEILLTWADDKGNEPDVGSSSMSTSGLDTSSSPMLTRRISPPLIPRA